MRSVVFNKYSCHKKQFQLINADPGPDHQGQEERECKKKCDKKQAHYRNLENSPKQTSSKQKLIMPIATTRDKISARTQLLYIRKASTKFRQVNI